MQQKYVYKIFVVILSFLAVWFCSDPTIASEKNVVVSVDTVITHPESGNSGMARVELRMKSGPQSGNTVEYTHYIWGHSAYDPPLESGSEFLAVVSFNTNNEINRIQLKQTRREISLLVLFGVVSLALFLVAGREGLIGLGCTVLTLGMLVFLFLPYAFNPFFIPLMGAGVCLVSIVVTVSLIMRFEPPTIPSIGSLIIVLSGVWVLARIGFNYLNLNAGLARHSRILMTYINRGGIAQVHGILPSLIVIGIVIGTLGALMDVSVVISSTVYEIGRDQDEPSLTELFWSGISVGQEILSTMINTLVFAYLGILFPIFLAFHVFDLSVLSFINFSFVGIEILRLCVGIIGLSLIIPVTSATSAWWIHERKST